jgi:hypothetical protein
MIGSFNWFDFYPNGIKLLYFNPDPAKELNIVFDDASKAQPDALYGPLQYPVFTVGNQSYPPTNYNEWNFANLPTTVKISGKPFAESTNDCLNRNLNPDGTVRVERFTSTPVTIDKLAKAFRSTGNTINNVDISKILDIRCASVNRKRKNTEPTIGNKRPSPPPTNVNATINRAPYVTATNNYIQKQETIDGMKPLLTPVTLLPEELYDIVNLFNFDNVTELRSLPPLLDFLTYTSHEVKTNVNLLQLRYPSLGAWYERFAQLRVLTTDGITRVRYNDVEQSVVTATMVVIREFSNPRLTDDEVTNFMTEYSASVEAANQQQ